VHMHVCCIFWSTKTKKNLWRKMPRISKRRKVSVLKY
jgi:hypothetical protein